MEYYPVPKTAVNYSQLKYDIGSGVIAGLFLNKFGEPEMGGFFINDAQGNALNVYNTGGVSFVNYNLPTNDASGILSALMRHYNFQVKVNGEQQLFTPDNVGMADEIVGDVALDVVPINFNEAYEGRNTTGMWGRKYRYIRYERTKEGITRVKGRKPNIELGKIKEKFND